MSRTTLAKWLYVGLHLKRWMLVILFGVVLMGLGISYLLREVYVSYTFPAWVGDVTLQFLPRWVRGMIFIGAASAATLIGAWKLNHSIVSAVVPIDRQDDLLDRIWERRTRGRGPRVVAIGGGTGLSTLLRGLKGYNANLTAIVTVADDGGSSGRLRRDLHVIRPATYAIASPHSPTPRRSSRGSSSTASATTPARASPVTPSVTSSSSPCPM